MKNNAPQSRLPRWADALLTTWVLLVTIVFFGPYALPWVGAERAGAVIGAWTQPASLVYLVLITITVVSMALKYLRRGAKAAEQNE